MSINKDYLAGRLWFFLKHPWRAIKIRQRTRGGYISDTLIDWRKYCETYRLNPPINPSFKDLEFEHMVESIWYQSYDDGLPYTPAARTHCLDMMYDIISTLRGGLEDE